MTDDEINQACAKALGWEQREEDIYGDDSGDEAPLGTRLVWYDGMCSRALPDFCNDHNAAAMLRAEVAKRGLKNDFVDALQELLTLLNESDGGSWFSFLNASPRLQAQVFLEVVKSDEERLKCQAKPA